MVRELRRFGVPYQLTWAGSFLLTFGDRFFLQAGWGVAAVGLYGMAYQFGFLLSQLGATPFLSAWNPHRHQLVSLPAADATGGMTRDSSTSTCCSSPSRWESRSSSGRSSR